MSVTDAVQVALYERLISDAQLSGLVGGRIHDQVPVDAAHPYVSFGPEDWPQVRGDCLRAIEGTVQIDVWSRDVGRREAKRIMDRVCAILHEAELALAAPARAVDCEVILRRILIDPDGLTTHGVVQVSILAEEAD